MKKKKYMMIFLCLLLLIGAGCNTKKNTHSSIDETSVGTETKNNVKSS